MRLFMLTGLALGLCGCTMLSGQPSNVEVLRLMGEHAAQCDRHYQGGLGVGASFTFNIDCRGQAPAPRDGSGPAEATEVGPDVGRPGG